MNYLEAPKSRLPVTCMALVLLASGCVSRTAHQAYLGPPQDDDQVAHLHGIIIDRFVAATWISIMEIDGQPTPYGYEDLTLLPGGHCVHIARHFAHAGLGGSTYPSQEFCFSMLAGHHYQIHHEGNYFGGCETLDWFWITDGSDGRVVAGEPATDEQMEFGVIPVGNNLYSILRSSCTVSRSLDDLEAAAYSDADTFCTQLGKKMTPLSSEVTAPGGWSTFTTGKTNAVELQFHCLTEKDQ
jgi:hypothetical protein